jgi:predicted transglutaminase-like cysteine proteinase
MLRSLLALSLFAASPVTPQTTAPIPVDTIARTKFPQEDGKIVDALAELNRFVNQGITYQDDMTHYGVNDLWVQVPADSKGDCEDYALTKLFMLQEAGFPTISNTKIVMLIVHTKQGVLGHAILAVLLPHGAVAYLDLNNEPMTRPELKAKGYQFFDWVA